MADSTPQKTETTTTAPPTKNWWESDTTGGLGCATLLLIGAIFMLYQVDWSGLRGKNVWDWFELIIVPLVLAGGGFMLQRFESDRLKQQEALEKQRIHEQTEREREQAKNNLMDNIFQSYLDDISTLLIDKRLQTMLDIVTDARLKEEAAQKAAEDKESADEQTIESANGAQQEAKPVETPPAVEIDNGKLAEAKAIVTVARARTVTALRSLDIDRRDLLFNFLRETGLVTGEKGTLLVGIQLSGVDLSNAYLDGFNLSKAYLSQVNLQHTWLLGANLSHALLRDVNLSYTFLSNANLSHALLRDVNLSHASLKCANLSDSILWGVNLSHIGLEHANLSYTNLERANLSNAYLGDANLSHANLSQANLYNARLDNANFSAATLYQANLKWAMFKSMWFGDEDKEQIIFDNRTILPDSSKTEIEEAITGERNAFNVITTYDRYWSADIDMTRYTDPEHPDFWEPPYLKPGYTDNIVHTPWWSTLQATDETNA